MTGGYVGSILTAGNIAATATAQAPLAATPGSSLLNASQLVTLPSNYLYLGKILRITVQFALSNLTAAQPTFTFQHKLGSIVVFTSGAITSSTTANTYLPCELITILKVFSVGSGTAATIMGVGKLTGLNFAVGAVANGTYGTSLMVPQATPAVGTGFDSTIANILDFWAFTGTSSAGNNMQVFNYNVEDLN